MTANPARPRRLVLLGSVFVELVLSVPELPARGSDIRSRSGHAEVGGGFAVLSAACRHGLPAALAGCYGTGPFGAAVAAGLTAEGITPLLGPVPGGDTGFRTGFVEPGDAHTSVTNPGVEAHLDEAMLAQVDIEPTDAVYVSGIDLTGRGTGQAIARRLRALPAGTQVVFDPGPWVDEIDWPLHRNVLARATTLTMTSAAARQLVGPGRPGTVFRALAEYAPRLDLAVLRAGADGCQVSTGPSESPLEVPAPPMDMASRPDVGGVHTGALLGGLAHGTPTARAALRANVAAGLYSAARRHGCPSGAAVDRFLATKWSGD